MSDNQIVPSGASPIEAEKPAYASVGSNVNMIRKGRVKWLAKEDAIGQSIFINAIFGLAAAA